MGSMGADEATAAPGLRIAVDFYTAKTERLLRRRAELESELALVSSELAKATGTRDQLSEVLVELTANSPSSDQGQTEPTAADSAQRSQPEDSGPGQETGAPADTGRETPRGEASTPGASGLLMQAILQILVTAGRPLRAREITEALGRPASGREGRVPVETTRSTCKRLVKNGKAVEDPVGVFAVARSGNPYARGAA